MALESPPKSHLSPTERKVVPGTGFRWLHRAIHRDSCGVGLLAFGPVVGLDEFAGDEQDSRETQTTVQMEIVLGIDSGITTDPSG